MIGRLPYNLPSYYYHHHHHIEGDNRGVVGGNVGYLVIKVIIVLEE